MTTKTINLYQFEELTDKAKDKAREWWRECEAQEFGGFGEIYESAITAGKLLGIEFKQHAVTLMSGENRYDPEIWYALDGQGQGASFAGSYSYAKGSSKAVRAEFGTNAELWRIADELTAIQKRYRYHLTALVSHSHSCHEYGMSTEEIMVNGIDVTTEEDVLQLMRDFAKWIYKGIEAEYDYRMSDENVNDCLKANEYTFTADGKRED